MQKEFWNYLHFLEGLIKCHTTFLLKHEIVKLRRLQSLKDASEEMFSLKKKAAQNLKKNQTQKNHTKKT